MSEHPTIGGFPTFGVPGIPSLGDGHPAMGAVDIDPPTPSIGDGHPNGVYNIPMGEYQESLPVTPPTS